MKIQFVIPGIPVAQPRVKSTRRGNHSGVYTPTKTSTGKSNGVAEFKALAKMVAAKAYTGSPLDGPLRVDLEFVFPRQSNKTWKTRQMPRYRKVTKPDRDNLDKCLMDSLTGILWVDDNQVCAGEISKWHASGGEQAHVLVTVQEIPETE